MKSLRVALGSLMGLSVFASTIVFAAPDQIGGGAMPSSADPSAQSFKLPSAVICGDGLNAIYASWNGTQTFDQAPAKAKPAPCMKQPQKPVLDLILSL